MAGPVEMAIADARVQPGMARLRFGHGGTPAVFARSNRAWRARDSYEMGESMSNRPNPAKESLKQEKAEQRANERRKQAGDNLTEALEDTFPASDPVAVQTATKPGARKRA